VPEISGKAPSWKTLHRPSRGEEVLEVYGGVSPDFLENTGTALVLATHPVVLRQVVIRANLPMFEVCSRAPAHQTLMVNYPW
jgi:hypothetical protein